MSELNYLEKLLDGTEVEWKALGDVTSVLRGKRLTKNLLSAEEKFPVFHGGLEPLGYYNKSNRPANTVMIINVGASAGTVGYSTVDFWSSDGCFCLEHNELLNNRFLYFALIGYQSLLKSKVRVAGIPTLDAIVVNKLLIPIPCPENPEKSLAIQSKIVRILDRFSALTAELTAELNMRKKQYNYYRDQLLSFDEEQEKPIYLEKLLDGVEVEWKPLKDVCDFKNGFAFKSSLFKETGLPIVRITNIDGFNVDLDEVKYFSLNDYKEDLSSFEVSMGNILIAMSGATTGKVGIYKKGTKCYLNQRVGKFIPKENILNNNYLYHFLLLNTETIYILAGGGAQPNLSSNALMSKLLIPIPCPDNPKKSLAIQSEIVRILDKFDTLTNSITEGLPREIELRQKQYEYYRDLLFSFPKPETVSK
ncbi:TPA: restriction endonuclease subunit S [Escherichia coli]|nr:restriction endonuclease subunit S [Escherichia coli]HEI1631593.1 restriction endonuclease subunit S [Escherichia coli]